ncbi:hypothetical protein GCM10009801_49400 [Streptomyces albiaxialis]|uniref:OmpR/PhoB-type domain-containing protein n=1 Tax=Streptomyces albiaxialis TaxID=329523 RepID=A0ABP5HW90_9ACTN
MGPYKQQLLLATLLCRPDTVVSVDHLIDTLWNDDPPKKAAKNLQVHVHHLRRALKAGGGGARVLYQRPGYRLAVAPEQIDMVCFEQHVDHARRATLCNEHEQVDRLARQAVVLWRGRPFTGFEGAAPLEKEADRLEERRLSVLEMWFSARLELGLYHEVVDEVEPLVTAHPYRELLRAQYMRALVGIGRQIDALNVFDETRRLFALELGLEPGTVLQQVQQSILAGEGSRPPAPRDPEPVCELVAEPVRERAPEPVRDRAPEPVSGEGSGGGSGEDAGPAPGRTAERTAGQAHRPVQLPPGIPDFTGRRHALAAVLPGAGTRPGPAGPWQLTVVTGRPGVGKSALAVAAAHAAESLFPGGRYSVDLLDERGRPKLPAVALAELLQELGHPLPSSGGLSSLVWEYRARMAASEPVLVLLDNASAESQVRPLLPSDPGCTTLVTSNSRLSGLAGARVLELEPLTTQESVLLLGRIVGEERVAAEPGAALRIAAACDGLPLALRVVGARLAARRTWPLSREAAALESQDRLEELTAGDVDLRERLLRGYTGVSDADWSAVRLLDQDGEFTFEVARRLLGTDDTETRRTLDRLADTHLLDCTPRAGFRLPGLVRGLARERGPASVAALTL